jgi:hypothetical protein
MSKTKSVRTVTLGWEEFVIPAGMTEAQVILLVGQLAMLDRISSTGTKDYKQSFYYYNDKQSVMVRQRDVLPDLAAATAAKEAYDSILLEKELTVS